MANVEDKKSKNGWGEWAHKVLGDLERLEEAQSKTTKSINQLIIDITVLKTRASFAGAVAGSVWAGIITTIVLLVVHFF